MCQVIGRVEKVVIYLSYIFFYFKKPRENSSFSLLLVIHSCVFLRSFLLHSCDCIFLSLIFLFQLLPYLLNRVVVTRDIKTTTRKHATKNKNKRKTHVTYIICVLFYKFGDSGTAGSESAGQIYMDQKTYVCQSK